MPPGPARIALAIITAPRQAFEEILQRRLVLQGVAVSAAVGSASFLLVLQQYYSVQAGSLLILFTANPVVSVGVLLVTAWIINYLSKLLGGDGDYPETVAVLGWASPITLVIYAVPALAMRPGGEPSIILVYLGLPAQIWLLLVVAVGLRQAHSMTIWRGGIAYLTGLIAYATARTLIAHNIAATQAPMLPLPSEAASSGQHVLTAWIAAAGLVFGSLLLARKLGYVENQSKKVTLPAGIVAVALAALGTWAIVSIDPAGQVARAHRDYQRGRYEQAISGYGRVLRVFPSDLYARTYSAHSLYALGRDAQALAEYEKPALRHSTDGLVGAGAVYLAQGKPGAAREKFELAARGRPGEPDVWLALFHARERNWEKAIEAAELSLKRGRSAMAYLVLAEAHSASGNSTEAEKHIKLAIEEEPDFEERFGSRAEDWSGASSQLTREDLRPPLIFTVDRPPAPAIAY